MRRRILASCLCIVASATLVTAQGEPPQEPGRGPGMRGLGPGANPRAVWGGVPGLYAFISTASGFVQPDRSFWCYLITFRTRRRG